MIRALSTAKVSLLSMWSMVWYYFREARLTKGVRGTSLAAK
jgi:hypothetical protein